MELSPAVLSYDLSVLAILVLDFLLHTRKTPRVLARVPVLLIPASMAVHAVLLEGPLVEFLAIGAGVMLTSLFGYFNFLAFVKRGVTLSMLHNHTRPQAERRPDRDYIALDQRIGEMTGHDWIRGDRENGYALTQKGARVLRIRRTLLGVLGIKAVG